MKAEGLTEEELAMAKREYDEEYPPPGDREVKLKTYPFKRYLDSRR